MGIRCKDATPTFCRMSDRGVNFFFDADGALERIYISLEDRKDPPAPDKVFGPFNGVFSSKAAFGMVPDAIIEELGKPDRIVPSGPNPNNTKEEHHYPSMVLEYDLASTGKLVLAGVTLRPKPGTVLPKPKLAAPAASGR